MMLQRLWQLHLDDRAAMAVDYTLILLTVVFPIALLVPQAMKTIQVYGLRVIEMVRIPFP